MILFLRFLPLAAVVSVFCLDRLTKFLVQRGLLYGQSVPVLPFFHITYVENTGAAFGMGQDRNTFFIFASIAILAVIFFLARKVSHDRWQLRLGFALVVGGALGNLYDRIVYGSVIDFLDFFVGDHHWPAFNVADSAICVGAALLAFSKWDQVQKSETPSQNT